MNISNCQVIETITQYCKQFALKKVVLLSKRHHRICQPNLIHNFRYVLKDLNDKYHHKVHLKDTHIDYLDTLSKTVHRENVVSCSVGISQYKTNELNNLDKFTRLEYLEIGYCEERDFPDVDKLRLSDAAVSNLCNMIQLQHLSLNKVLHAIPNDIMKLTKLITLDLHHNNLTFIPDSLYELVNLEYFWLNDNDIGSISNKIGNLTQLKLLSLAANNLKSLPDSLYELKNLEHLYLGFNELTIISSKIGNLCKLEKIYINNNKIIDIPECIFELPQLRVLNFTNNNIPKTTFDAYIIELVKKKIMENDYENFKKNTTTTVTLKQVQKIIAKGKFMLMNRKLRSVMSN